MEFCLVGIRLPSPLDLQVNRYSTDEENNSKICSMFENLHGLFEHLRLRLRIGSIWLMNGYCDLYSGL